jgi:DNA-binding CsgD family transcriptional regulator
MRRSGIRWSITTPPPSCGIGGGNAGGGNDGAEDLEDAGSRNHNLTARQNAVLELLSRGDSNKAIARRLAIREGTGKVHVRQILRVRSDEPHAGRCCLRERRQVMGSR